MPDATGLELIAQELRERDADSVLNTEFFREKAAITVTGPRAAPREASSSGVPKPT